VLRQRDIAVQFGVSQTPVREALRRLESEGLVVSDAHRGATVAEAREGWVEENYQIRAALESLGARLAAQSITDKQLAELVELNERMKVAGEDQGVYGPLNKEFHFRIYAVAGSPLLLSLMRLLWNSMPTGPHVARSHDDSVAQHQALLDALCRHDGDAADQLMRDHILGSAHLDPDRHEEQLPNRPLQEPMSARAYKQVSAAALDVRGLLMRSLQSRTRELYRRL
jgi:DNA-binding GntR family transcriptional regulator